MTSSTLPPNHRERMARAHLALIGLSVGDALGETCFDPDNFNAIIEDFQATARSPWLWTDDTAMALGIFEVLDKYGSIEQDDLAQRFASRWQAAPWRGYGAGAHRLLSQIIGGIDWRDAAGGLFGGGSFGNGSAMRIAPLAAYFAEDGFEIVAKQAALSAAITHAHSEGIAGAIATAVSGAYAWLNRDGRGDLLVKRGLFESVLAHTPASVVREGIEQASQLSFGVTGDSSNISFESVVQILGNGSKISCQDTVPLCLWVAARYLNDYEAAILNTIRASGDIDTNCAIVGGIVALAAGIDMIPRNWISSTEDLWHEADPITK